VVTVDAASIAPAPALVRGLSGAYLLGMVTHKEQVVLVLDIAKVLTASEVLMLQELHSDTSKHRND
jgi:chemotaxis signal transduction protein